jgi:hypothetical protein
MAAPAISHGTVKMNDLMNVTSGQPFANNFETKLNKSLNYK